MISVCGCFLRAQYCDLYSCLFIVSLSSVTLSIIISMSVCLRLYHQCLFLFFLCCCLCLSVCLSVCASLCIFCVSLSLTLSFSPCLRCFRFLDAEHTKLVFLVLKISVVFLVLKNRFLCCNVILVPA